MTLQTFFALQRGRIRTDSLTDTEIQKKRFAVKAKRRLDPNLIEEYRLEEQVAAIEDPVRYWYKKTGLLYE